ncbi:hypothetical protein GCM10027572_16410 [Flexivirga lutea]
MAPPAAAELDEVSLGLDSSLVAELDVVDSDGADSDVFGDAWVGAAAVEVATGAEPVGVVTLAVSPLQAASPIAPAMATAPTRVRRNMLLDMTFLR